MDADEVLRELRSLVRVYDGQELSTGAAALLAAEMVEKFRYLDDWLSRGAFLPDAWVQKRGSLGD